MLDRCRFGFSLSFFGGGLQGLARPRLHRADCPERDREPEQLAQELLRTPPAEMIDAGQHRNHGDEARTERRRGDQLGVVGRARAMATALAEDLVQLPLLDVQPTDAQLE